ncbi:8400_t:CDS:1, partial [Dentiscutata erythropus]
ATGATTDYLKRSFDSVPYGISLALREISGDFTSHFPSLTFNSSIPQISQF